MYIEPSPPPPPATARQVVGRVLIFLWAVTFGVWMFWLLRALEHPHASTRPLWEAWYCLLALGLANMIHIAAAMVHQYRQAQEDDDDSA